MMVGESGGSYYARPAELAIFNGPRAYENYAGRNEALAIDAYDNIARMARPKLAYFSCSETAWFGIEHLPFGYRDLSRLPNENDGVFLTHPFTQGTPGMQPERLPPYVCTLNPGWDSTLPLYKPLAMFDAEKAALAAGAPAKCRWDHKSAAASLTHLPGPPIGSVAFDGSAKSPLYNHLIHLGVPIGTPSVNASSV